VRPADCSDREYLALRPASACWTIAGEYEDAGEAIEVVRGRVDELGLLDEYSAVSIGPVECDLLKRADSEFADTDLYCDFALKDAAEEMIARVTVTQRYSEDDLENLRAGRSIEGFVMVVDKR